MVDGVTRPETRSPGRKVNGADHEPKIIEPDRVPVRRRDFRRMTFRVFCELVYGERRAADVYAVGREDERGQIGGPAKHSVIVTLV